MITKTYDLILWSCNHTSKFPRNHRFVLGERIERNLYGLLETLIAAEYTKNRQRLLEDANLSLEVLRFQMRLAKDLQCLKVESYAFAARSIDEIGRLIGGWLRSRARKMTHEAHGNLWDRMISFGSLLKAAHSAARGKRSSPALPASSSISNASCSCYTRNLPARPTVPVPTARSRSTRARPGRSAPPRSGIVSCITP